MQLQPVFRDCEAVGGAVAEELFARGLCLPSGAGMSEGDQMQVVEVVERTRMNAGCTPRRNEKSVQSVKSMAQFVRSQSPVSTGGSICAIVTFSC